MRLPRHIADHKQFCGTALVEFSTEEDATNVLKKSLVYAGVELQLKPKYVFSVSQIKVMLVSVPFSSGKLEQLVFKFQGVSNSEFHLIN